MGKIDHPSGSRRVGYVMNLLFVFFFFEILFISVSIGSLYIRSENTKRTSLLMELVKRETKIVP